MTADGEAAKKDPQRPDAEATFSDEDVATWLLDEHDRLLVRDVLALTPRQRLETLAVADAFFRGATRSKPH